MRKQTKIAAVVSAAALLALGASITSFAAERGTWMLVDGEWYCYDSYGDPYENTFCLSNGREYYVGDDGMLVRSQWVEDDGYYYFVNSAGEKITNDWRLTTPYDDEDAEEQWYYFQSNGRMAENKKLTIRGNTYFFDSEGTMLTGWVQVNDSDVSEGDADIATYDGDTYYCDESGARLEGAWVRTYAPEVDEEDADVDDEEYYYLKSNGEVATGRRNNISGQTYFFGEDGKMLYGWVAESTSSNGEYEMIWEYDDDEDGSYDVPLSAYYDTDVYFCGDEMDGHMKRNKWIKLWNNQDYGEDDEDNDEYWFYINSNGTFYIPSGSDATMQKMDFEDGEAENLDEVFTTDGDPFQGTEKRINSRTYLFDQNGQMIAGLVQREVNVGTEDAPNVVELMYYYGGDDDGEMKDGSVSIEDEVGETYRFYFATEENASDHYHDGAGVNGARSGRLYRQGLIVTAQDYRYEVKEVNIDGTDYEFIVNRSGSIQTSARDYEDDGDVVVPADNWTIETNSGAGALRGHIISR